jgi:hypothetical protein
MRRGGVEARRTKNTSRQFDWGEMFDSLSEDVRLLVDRVQAFKFAGYVICGCLNLVLLLSIFSSSRPHYLQDYYEHVYLADLLAASFSYVLLLVSIANTYLFFTRKKTYHLMRCDPSEMARSSNLRPAMISVPEGEGIESAVEVLELNIWNPAAINRDIFIFFSPLQVFFEISMYRNVALLFILSVGTAYLLFLILDFYEQRIVDTQILTNQAYNELNHFAVSRMSVIKEDKGVQVGTLFREAELSNRYNPGGTNTYFSSHAPVKRRNTNPFQSSSHDDF